ncbi:uncharacterized protein LOC115230754 [Octopus sinensis]|uniref:Phosphomevalonate kinase n=1 Tax=Octopus sinensis TaxID=2607531 RepID=A0A6P7U3A1_9MOLL|nr:uncharacterized protein LOC115230754 [Octopus sinensis]
MISWGENKRMTDPGYFARQLFNFFGVDDSESECGLDEGVDWDFVISNDTESPDIDSLVRLIQSHLIIND